MVRYEKDTCVWWDQAVRKGQSTGSKNAALPVLAATILTGDTNLISNCPVITDVYQMLNLLQAIGCSVCRVREGVRIDAGCQRACRIPEEMVKQMRSSM